MTPIACTISKKTMPTICTQRYLYKILIAKNVQFEFRNLDHNISFLSQILLDFLDKISLIIHLSQIVHNFKH